MCMRHEWSDKSSPGPRSSSDARELDLTLLANRTHGHSPTEDYRLRTRRPPTAPVLARALSSELHVVEARNSS